jgi:ribosomal protein S18 acetylase RimI-like enzyme
MLDDVTNYSAIERLRDGRKLEVRTLRPADQAEILSALARTSTPSLYRRFFSIKKSFSEKEKAFFLNVDFKEHVALVACADEEGRNSVVGGGRYVVLQKGKAELAFLVIDQYQGQGIGGLLTKHLVRIARARGIETLVAEVLSENTAMLKVFERSGLAMTSSQSAGIVHVNLKLE